VDGRVRVQPINQLIQRQIILLAIAVLTIFWWRESGAALACLYGCSIAIANTLLQRMHLIGSAAKAKSDAGMNLRKAYRCVLERWVLTVILFSVGFGMLALSAPFLLAGFILTQSALLFGIKNRT